MATFGCKRQRSLRDWLLAEPWEFNFFQAVRLLELGRPDAASPGETSEPAREVVRFRSSPSLAFPANDVQQLTADHPPVMTVNFLGLAGAHGPLPLPQTQQILDRSAAKDTGLRDFLDIFNHRFVSLFYRVRKAHRIALTARPPHETPVARYLFSFFGLGPRPLRNRLRTGDRALLHYSGLLSQKPHSAIGLQLLLSDMFQVKVAIAQFVGGWRDLQPQQCTKIGLTGRNQVLGDSAAAGTRVWDQQGQFAVHLGPMGLAQFLDLLPNGRGWQPLCEVIRFYVGTELDFRFRLALVGSDVQNTRLGKSFLGWTSWLHRERTYLGRAILGRTSVQQMPADDSQVQLHPCGFHSR